MRDRNGRTVEVGMAAVVLATAAGMFGMVGEVKEVRHCDYKQGHPEFAFVVNGDRRVWCFERDLAVVPSAVVVAAGPRERKRRVDGAFAEESRAASGLGSGLVAGAVVRLNTGRREKLALVIGEGRDGGVRVRTWMQTAARLSEVRLVRMAQLLGVATRVPRELAAAAEGVSGGVAGAAAPASVE